MRWPAVNPWSRKAVQITCHDAADHAAHGDEDAILVNDEMRARNRGAVVVFARPGENIWHLAFEALQVIPDMQVEPLPPHLLHAPGHG